MLISIKRFINKFKNFQINGKIFKINDKIFFKQPYTHPYTGEKEYYGIVVGINNFIMPNIITLYMADAISYGEGHHITSWVRDFTLDELKENG